jgi:hypothetical protein
MGWQYIDGSWDDPQVPASGHFKQVLMSARLRPILDSQIAALVKHVGASPRSVQVRELGYRWGSVQTQGRFTFLRSVWRWCRE